LSDSFHLSHSLDVYGVQLQWAAEVSDRTHDLDEGIDGNSHPRSSLTETHFHAKTK